MQELTFFCADSFIRRSQHKIRRQVVKRLRCVMCDGRRRRHQRVFSPSFCVKEEVKKLFFANNIQEIHH